jgi:hypothetical protein
MGEESVKQYIFSDVYGIESFTGRFSNGTESIDKKVSLKGKKHPFNSINKWTDLLKAKRYLYEGQKSTLTLRQVDELLNQLAALSVWTQAGGVALALEHNTSTSSSSSSSTSSSSPAPAQKYAHWTPSSSSSSSSDAAWATYPKFATDVQVIGDS